MKKKGIAFTVAALMALSLTACGGEDKASTTAAATAANTTVAATTTAPAAETTAPATAAGGSEASFELFLNEANGLSIGLPENVTYAQTNDNGVAVYTNETGSIVVTIGPKNEQAITAESVTEEVLTQAMNGMDNAEFGNMGTVEQNGGTSVVGFGTGSVNGTKKNLAVQYFIPQSGDGYYTVSYLYDLSESSFDDNIATVLASVAVAG